MHKLYCYVDESGQDTVASQDQDPFFLVAVAVFQENRSELESTCRQYERESGKGMRKWHGCNHESRMAYLRAVLGDARFRHALCYTRSRPKDATDFDARTILGIAKAIHWRNPPEDYTSDIFIDGISQSKQAEYAKELRAIGIHVRRVHRARDDSAVLIRLVDALAGLARLEIEGRDEAALLIRAAVKRGTVTAL